MNTAASNRYPAPGPQMAQSLIALLVVLAVIGFGPSYINAVTFSGKTFTLLVHAHGALMALWLGMLVAQPWFIATGRMAMHRCVGRASFVVVPLVIASSLVAAHEQLGRESAITTDIARVAVFNLGMVIALGGAWALALINRGDVLIHMRFMISTGFAIATAAVTRVFINWVPGFGAPGPALAATAALLLIPLVALIFLDWRAGIRHSPYWFVTIVIAIMHLGYWTWGTTGAWLAFIRNFAGSV